LIKRLPYDVAAFIQVISALVMPRSFAAKLLITVIEPVRKEVIATAIVTKPTNKHSWSVDMKHSGRALGSLSLIGCVVAVADSDSGSDVTVMVVCGAMWVVMDVEGMAQR
jgi:hypothetical protein